MKKIDLGQAITILANVGVVAGIVFLVYEIRQNTAQMRADAGYSINEAVDSLNRSVYEDREFAELLLQAQESFSEMDRVDQARIASYFFSELNLADYISKLESEGMSDLHFDYVEFKVNQFRSMPGRREFVDQYVAPSDYFGSEELYRRLTEDPSVE